MWCEHFLQVLLLMYVFILLNKCLRKKFLGHRWLYKKLFFKGIFPFYILINNFTESLSCFTFSSTFCIINLYSHPSGWGVIYHYAFNSYFPDVWWWWASYSYGFWPLFIFFWGMSVWVICPFCSLGHLSFCRIFGYILDRSSFSDTCIVSISSQSVDFLFTFLTMSLNEELIFIWWCLIYLSTLSIMVIAVWVLSKKFLSSLEWQRFSPLFSF